MKTPREELRFDLSGSEGTPFASLSVALTDPNDDTLRGKSFPPGITLSADRGAHGADLHLSWQQTRELRDALSVLLRDAGEE